MDWFRYERVENCVGSGLVLTDFQISLRWYLQVDVSWGWKSSQPLGVSVRLRRYSEPRLRHPVVSMKLFVPLKTQKGWYRENG